MIPPVLTEMCDFLSESRVPLTRTDNARIDSATNEKTVLEKLSERFAIEQQPQARHWWDFSIRDDGVLLPVNLKLTELGNANDNMNCKLGIYYALTGREPDFANETPWHDFFERLAGDMQENSRDYYFLVVNKNDSADVFAQGLRTLGTLTPNGNNLPFQCCWRDNREPQERSFGDARDFLLSVFAQSIKRRAKMDNAFQKHFPKYWEEA